MKLPTGKLDSDLLKRIVFDRITYRDDQVRVRPGIGEDCAVVDFGQWDCVMSTDPISSAVADIGRLCIHITCNDVASNGVKPLGIMLAVMLPVGTTEEDVEHIMGQAADTAAELEVEIIGGHTEITPAVKQPVIVSTAIGKAPQGGSQSESDMVPGDYIMMTKSCGLEGAAIAATDFEEELLSGRAGSSGEETNVGETNGEETNVGVTTSAGVMTAERMTAAGEMTAGEMTAEEIRRAKSFLDQVSVVPEGIAAGKVGTHGMHDITEGGILGAIWEMCQISGCGARIREEDIPIEPETKKICRFFDLDPLRLISSGSMVIIVAEDKKDEMLAALDEAGVPASIIGRVCPAEEGIRLARGKAERPETAGAQIGETGDVTGAQIGETGDVTGAQTGEAAGPETGEEIDPPRMDEIYKIIERKG